MTQRIDYNAASQNAIEPVFAASQYLRSQTTLEPTLLHLVDLRVSQINGCAFCIAMHWREGRESGATDDQMHGLAAWRETSWYSPRERAALAWAEAVTNVATSHVPDDIFEQVRAVFSETEIVDLTLAVATINTWNRLSISFRVPPERAVDLLAHANA
ncbi:MAG TPA: carboxymuconolactone decarboxylase family protein [Candidatus Baltobacteraceae bacterium]|jgi:AhpD family alkylhydroperoxidase